MFDRHGSDLARIVRAGCAAALSLALLTTATASSAECGFLPDFDASCDRESRPSSGVNPMSMPYLFEDPFITTGVQLVGIWHDSPKSSVLAGGNVGVIALQARIALTDRIAFIATKDGVTFLRPDPIPGFGQVLPEDTDLMDITVGFKFAVVKTENLIITPSIRYEIPIGAEKLFQGQGDGVLIPAVSVGWGREAFHVIADFGAQAPFDGDADSASLFYNLHLDYAVHEHVVPFVELNGTHWTNSGDGSSRVHTVSLGAVPLAAAQALLGTGGFEGADVANLGSPGVAGNDLLTMAWGARFPLDGNTSLGFSYERAITQRKDIFKQRITAMVTYEF